MPVRIRDAAHEFAFFFVKVNALTMMGGWVAIVSDRKSRIALFEVRLHDAECPPAALVHGPRLVCRTASCTRGLSDL